MGGWFGNRRRSGLYSLGVIALLVIGVSAYLVANLFGGDASQVERATPVAVREASQKTIDQAALVERADIQEGLEAAARACLMKYLLKRIEAS